MRTRRVKISEIYPNPENPRTITDEKFKKLVASIRAFPQMLELRPIVVNADMVVLGGNMRLKACQAAGLSEVPIIEAEELTPEQEREFIIKDNVGFGEWEWETLANEWDAEELSAWGLDLPVWEKEISEAEAEQKEIDESLAEYSKKIKAPVYEPKNEKPAVEMLVDRTRYQDLLATIHDAGLPDRDRAFLELAAMRHLVFNYELIADYYAHSSSEVQRLMEASALVIIDFDKAIEHGFVALSSEIIDQYKHDQHTAK